VSDIRVRFCPSPTGNPHVGLVRTGLFNWAYARHVGGTFIFRIEDTDVARDSEESYGQLLDTMRWLGLDWDEGPEVGGPFGPYRQSQRRDIYRDVVERLIAAGHTYESYSTAEEIEARHVAAGRNPKLGYDNFDRELSAAQIEAFRADGREPVLRVRMPDEDLSWTDIVRGEVTYAAGNVPDFVVVRANGDPLYTLVNPVDDAMMRITHVLRGEDLLPSTPRQIALYRALLDIGVAEWTPRFGHLPYVMGEGNRKLSKRDPQAGLATYRAAGFIPEGMLNYLALLGWSIAEDRDVFSLAEMVAAFDVADVNANPARFDPIKCEAINATSACWSPPTSRIGWPTSWPADDRWTSLSALPLSPPRRSCRNASTPSPTAPRSSTSCSPETTSPSTSRPRPSSSERMASAFSLRRSRHSSRSPTGVRKPSSRRCTPHSSTVSV
jgi:glutamyl-tRNA synthetase